MESRIAAMMNAASAKRGEVMQTLWSGYGEIVRYRLWGCERSSVIVKHIQLPDNSVHPRGWNTARSHQRKVRSYQIERRWYEEWSQQCGQGCRVPLCFGTVDDDEGQFLLLEDMDEAGYPDRRSHLSRTELLACLRWLASFHAQFLGESPAELWKQGTYWHLATRPEEWEAMETTPLKAAAAAIDEKLFKCKYKTLVHGDAKVANFCFSPDGTQVAAVDFQYVGGGCGMKDVAYLFSSCLDEETLEQLEDELLDDYFFSLRDALRGRMTEEDCASLEQEWREIYPFAWADFVRFLQGWMPGHWKLNGRAERLTEVALWRL